MADHDHDDNDDQSDHEGHDEHDGNDDHEDHSDHGDGSERTTAPMQAFSTAQVGIGFAVLLVGLVLTFGLAFGFVGI